MGISENHRRNDHGQQRQQLLHRHHLDLDNQLDHTAPAPAPAAGMLDARQQVFPADWHHRHHMTQQQQQLRHHHATKAATESHVAAAAHMQDAASTPSSVESMDVDHQYDCPESGDQHSAKSVSPLQRPLPALHSHFATPVMRFKAAHGYVRKLDESSQQQLSPHSSPKLSAAADPRSLSPVTPSGIASNTIRWPTLALPGTPPLSPHSRWSVASTSSPRSSFGEAFPSPRHGLPLTASESLRQAFQNSSSSSSVTASPRLSGFTAPPGSPLPQSSFTLAPLRRGCESPANGSTLPSLASLASSLPDNNNNSSHDYSTTNSDAATLALNQVGGGPFQYERSQSCPSDECKTMHAGADYYHAAARGRAAAPLYVLKPSVLKNSLLRSYSVDGDSAAAVRPHSHLVSPPPTESIPQQQPPSMSAVRPCEQDAIQRWLESERQSQSSRRSLAESTQRLERSRSPSLSSGPSSPMSVPHSVTGGGTMSEDDEGMFGGDARREKKLCSFPQCLSNAVTRGKCISHGGGRRCQLKGCTRGAQSKGLCVAHGGKRKCRVEDCTKHVKKRGLCRSHANSMYAPSG